MWRISGNDWLYFFTIQSAAELLHFIEKIKLAADAILDLFFLC